MAGSKVRLAQGLVQRKLLGVIESQRWILVFLAQEAIAHGQRLDLRSHEAAERVLRRPYNGLAAHVEAGVHDYRTASQFLEPADQMVKASIGFLVNRLDPRGVIHVRDRRYIGARHVELGNAEKRLFLRGHGFSPRLDRKSVV